MLLLALLACDSSSDLQIDPGVGDDTGPVEVPGMLGVHCLLDPAPAEAAGALRVDDAGVLWHLGVSGVVTRYERQDDCVLYGQVVAGVEVFTEVTDLEIDPDGNAWLLVYFDELQRLDGAGNPLLSCEVPAGHALAPAAGRVYTWPIGATELAVTEVGETSCAAGAPVPLDRALGTPAAFGGGQLAAASHDPQGELAPGMLLDPASGALLADLPADGQYADEALRVVTDLAYDGGRWWVADGVDGNVWSLDADGAVLGAWSTRGTLPRDGDGDDAWYSPQAIAARAGQPLYLAAGDTEYDGVWELSP